MKKLERILISPVATFLNKVLAFKKEIKPDFTDITFFISEQPMVNAVVIEMKTIDLTKNILKRTNSEFVT